MSSASTTLQAVTDIAPPRRARDAVKGRERRPPGPLFDAFWREGELAMLFSEPGEGKSVLAVQIADAIARGEQPMPDPSCGSPHVSKGVTPNAQFRTLRRKKTRKVLYIDLVLSKKQFRERYSGYKFAKSLYRETPADGQGVFEFVKTMVARYGFKAVIIDDLSLVSRAADGTSETLALMHKLRQLTLDKGISVLVLADTYPFVYENQSPERGLRRSRVLCGVADSVFALYDGCVVQTRSRLGEKVWTLANKLRYTIAELDSGLPGMEFTPPKVDLRTSRDIVEIKEMHDDEEMTFREIAEELRISKSQAQRLYAQWTPQMAEEQKQRDEDDKDFPGCEEYDDALADTRFSVLYDDEGMWVEPTTREGWLLDREYELIEDARLQAAFAWEDTRVAPRLADNEKYKEFLACLASGGDPLEDLSKG